MRNDKRRIIAFWLTIGLLLTLFTLKNIEQVEAAAYTTIYIRSDGSIDPSNASISKSGNIYRMTNDINGSINIQRSNITLDGCGYHLYGPETNTGISLHNISNITIKNFRITSFNFGIFIQLGHSITIDNCTISSGQVPIRLYTTNNNNITNCTLSDGYWACLELQSSHNNIVKYNHMSNSTIKRGIFSQFSSNNTIIFNTFENNGAGILLWNRDNDDNTMENNLFIGNTLGIQVYGDRNRIMNNTLNESGGIIIAGSGNLIKNNSGVKDGMALHGDNNTVSSNIILNDGRVGINVYGEDHIIENNTIQNTSWAGIYIGNANRILIENNTIIDELDRAIYPSNASDIVIKGNKIINSGGAITCIYTRNISIFNNNITNSNILSFTGSRDISIHNNTLRSTGIHFNQGYGLVYNSHIGNNSIIDANYAFSINGVNNISIQNNDIINSTYWGFQISNMHYGDISNNNISENGRAGIVICNNCSYTNFENNTFLNNNWSGIMDSYGPWDGSHCTDIRVINNYFINNGREYAWNGAGLSFSLAKGLIIENNSIQGSFKDGIYLGVHNINCTVINNNISRNGQGITSSNMLNCTITQNLISNNDHHGLYLLGEDPLFIKNNTIINNNWSGIKSCGDNVTITNNTISGNEMNGIHLQNWVNYNTISNNIISYNNLSGINLQTYCENNSITHNEIYNNSENGIVLDYSDHTGINNNKIYNHNESGLRLWVSSYNEISENDIYQNNNGSYMLRSNNNQIYHNNFMNNTLQAYITQSLNNGWDNGYPSGGNYWDNWTSPDNNDDGIVDSPFCFTAYVEKDRYPLMRPFGQNIPYLTFNKIITNRVLDIEVNISIDRDGEILSIEWDFRDGNTGNGMITSNDYAVDGSYNVSVTVTDDDGYVFVGNQTIIIRDCPLMAADGSPDNGTTGDSYTFNITAEDNFEVESVYVEWTHGMNSGNISLFRVGDYWMNTIILDQSLENLTYNVHITDPSENHNASGPFNIIVWDNDRPIFGTDNTPTYFTTGDGMYFTIEVVDFFLVNKVTVEYWYGEGHHWELDMGEMTPGIYGAFIVIDHTLDALHYSFTAYDGVGNINVTGVRDITIIDNDIPTFWQDNSDDYATTGDDFKIIIEVWDNIDVDSVDLEFWIGGERTYLRLWNDGLSDHWSYRIPIPSVAQGMMNYTFHAKDSSNNWAISDEVDIMIYDNDRPRFGTDRTPDTATTGDIVTFSIPVMDDLGVDRAYLIYWHGTEIPTNTSMTHKNGAIWEKDIEVKDTLLVLHYYFKAVDTSENWNITDEEIILISDNDPPFLVSDISPDEGYTGKNYILTLEIHDNIKLHDVDLEYWFGEGDHSTMSPSSYGGLFSAVIRIPIGSILPLHYRVTAMDSSGLISIFDVVDVNIIDDVAPTIGEISDVVIYQGEEIDITAQVNDNINISSVKWTGGPIHGSGEELTGIVTVPGAFNVTVFILDEAGNSAETSFKITVLSVDHDRDGDGIPDLIEEEYLMDPDDPSDAILDFDSDGLNNLEEYQNGTNLEVSDTDNDGMPDPWELHYGLDPLTPSGDVDTDGDGKTDLQEYLDGTDPTKAETSEDGSSPLLSVFIILFFILLLIGGIGIFIYLKSKNNEEEEGENEVHGDRSFKDQSERQPSAELDLINNLRGGQHEK